MSCIRLIRHGSTQGNLLKRYIGVTDEPLCPEGREQLYEIRYPAEEFLFVSPMLRCRQSAGILFPDQKQIIVPGLRECDFGEFENRNAEELRDEPAWQAWIDSGGELSFPGGESREGFRARSLEAWGQILQRLEEAGQREENWSANIVTHGGVIMNIMEALSGKPGTFYSWHLETGACHEIRQTTGQVSLL